MTDRREFHDLADPADAAETIRSLDLDPGAERVPLADARGRVLAERVDAGIDVPGFDRASMDGYAVRAADTFGADEADPAPLDVVGAVHAGEAPDVVVEEGTAAEISTGAVMPDGADAVVMVERTDSEGGSVLVRTAVAPGDNVMHAGADVAAGERALGPGTRLTAREVGLLSALGVDEVPVRSRPRVGVVSTGDELVRPGDDLNHRRGQIHDVNSYGVAAAVEEAGGEPVVYPHAGGAAAAASPERASGPVGDDLDELERVLTRAAEECDLVLSSGSTSASAVDVIYRVIEDRGELLLHGVAVKPGKPMLVGTLGGAAYVGLPGYPVSALTIFRTFVAPAVRNAAGLPEPATATVEGRMAGEERYGEGRRRLMPAGLVEDGDGDLLVYPVDKGSGATTSLVEADGVVEVPADTEYLAAGERVTVELFSADVRPPSLLGVGEDDPALSRLLDRLSNPRYHAVGTREGVRRLRDGLPDVCVVAGDPRREVDAEPLGAWTREWGLVVPAGNPDGVEGLADLVDRDLRLVNRGTDSGLRSSLDDALAAIADERGERRRELADAVDGYDLTVRAHESPARTVAAGEADAGLGLRVTAERLGLGFVPLGDQRVQMLANSDRTDKPGVTSLATAIEEHLADALVDLAGYEAG
ncbi:molybdopterin biosynthesis protein [Halobacteriales archaeon QS_1_68_20]|nr:MAG: molybdopterin biosynthesis protein [Halobacteriales archaeon QS_1_68_20]